MMTNQDLESCKRDIEIIRSTMERSKVNLGSIAKLFLVYGGVRLFQLLGTRCLSVFLTHRYATEPWFTFLFHLFPLIHVATLVILFVFYQKNYNRLKQRDIPYTLQLYRLWGYALFYTPAFTYIVTKTVDLLFSYGILTGSGAPKALYVIPYTAEIAAFLFALICTGILLENKAITSVAAIALPLLLGIFFIGSENLSDMGLGDLYALYTHSEAMGWFAYVLLMLGYLLVGLYLLPKKDQKHGTL